MQRGDNADDAHKLVGSALETVGTVLSDIDLGGLDFDWHSVWERRGAIGRSTKRGGEPQWTQGNTTADSARIINDDPKRLLRDLESDAIQLALARELEAGC